MRPAPNFQTMINGSIAVLTKPAVSTFEEHERNSLQWAMIYTAIGSAISGVFTGASLAMQGQSFVLGLVLGVLIGFIGLLIYTALVFFIGRAFGGTGQFGEVAYDVSLYSAPMAAASSVLNLVPIIGPLLGLVLAIYNLYLSYLAIQSGMNLPKDKALYTILIILAIGLVVGCILATVLGAIIAAAIGIQTAP
jgi:hypothetical protein